MFIKKDYNVKNILKEYSALNVKVPEIMVSWMRSNHAGETGAVWIYRGSKLVFWNRRIYKMSSDHIETEIKHLIVINYLLKNKDKSKLLFLWRILGLILGFFSAIFGYKFFCNTVDAVETFVEKHYQEQIDYMINNKISFKLAMILKKCCDEEVDHQLDARKRSPNKGNLFIKKIWFKVVGSGSDLAVNVSKII